MAARTSASIFFNESQQTAAHLLDRVVLGAHLVDLLLGSVFGGIRHGMAAIPVGQHFENDGPVSIATPFDRLVARGLHGTHIHAIDLLAGNIEGTPALGQVCGCRCASNGGAHPVVIVFDDIDHRQLPELGHIEAFVDLALIGGAVAQIGQRDVVIAQIFVGDVHRAAFALRMASAPAGQLCHHALWIHTASQHVPVVAIAGDDLVTRLDRHLHADDDGLLTDVEVAEAADQPHAVELTRLFLETANPQHLLIGVELVLARPGGGRVGAARFRLVCGFGGNGHGVLGAILASLGLA